MSLTTLRGSSQSYPSSFVNSSHNRASFVDDNTTSVDRVTSASNPDDYYADISAANTLSSSKMRTKTTTTEAADQFDHAADNAARRASGRVRKLTAKAVALNGSKSYSPPLGDTIVIGENSPEPRPSSNKERSPTATPVKTEPEEVQIQIQIQPDIPDTPAIATVHRVISPSPEVVAHNVPSSIVGPTPSRRQSLRERKLTQKAFSENQTSQKRPATDKSEDAPVRKSARLSYSGAKIPSKLRHSVSSSRSDADYAEEVEVSEIPAAKKSKIVVLKFVQGFDLSTLSTQPKAKVGSATPKKKSRRAWGRQKLTAKHVAAESEPRPRPADVPQSCNLTCLSGSSKLLAFAHIAAQMPDDEDEDGEVVPGSANDWRTYTHAWCQCDQDQQLKPQRTNSAELARALMPNTVAQGTRQDPVDLSKPQTPDDELLLTPVNTILRASDAERLSQLYTRPRDQYASQSPNGLPSTNNKRPAQPSPRRVSISDSPSHHSPPAAPPPYPTRRTYEDRLRDDYNALAEIRKTAASRGISWTYNQTLDDIHTLIVDAEQREQQTQYRQQVINPPTVLGRAHEASEARPSPTGFGVLLPPKGSTFIQRTTNGQPQSPVPSSSTNGTPGSSNETPKPTKISFVEETNPANPPKARRPSSPSRPKSSRFRVDPRGLQGKLPGPGTIINMEHMKEKAAGLQRLAKAMSEYEAQRKLMNEREREQRERVAAEKKAKEAELVDRRG